jgi:hypothetical protein
METSNYISSLAKINYRYKLHVESQETFPVREEEEMYSCDVVIQCLLENNKSSTYTSLRPKHEQINNSQQVCHKQQQQYTQKPSYIPRLSLEPRTWIQVFQTNCTNKLQSWQHYTIPFELLLYYSCKYNNRRVLETLKRRLSEMNFIRLLHYVAYFNRVELLEWIYTNANKLIVIDAASHTSNNGTWQPIYTDHVYAGYCAAICDVCGGDLTLKNITKTINTKFIKQNKTLRNMFGLKLEYQKEPIVDTTLGTCVLVERGGIDRNLPKRIRSKFGVFFYACVSRNMDYINVIIDCNKDTMSKYTGTIGACIGGHLDLAMTNLVRWGTCVEDGFKYACKFGHLHLVQFLIEKGPDNYVVGLYKAAKQGHLPIVQYLAKITTFTFRQWFLALCKASLHRHANVIEWILVCKNELVGYTYYAIGGDHFAGDNYLVKKIILEKFKKELDTHNGNFTL